MAKGLYYPTPERIVDLIASTVDVVVPTTGGRILDTCAGTGVAARLGRAWGLETYGVELHAERAAECAQVMTKALHGSYHQLMATAGAFSVLFLNPPYDTGECGRQEVEFLRGAKEWLAPGGLLIFIPPSRILKSKALRDALGYDYRNVLIQEFPEPEYAAFGQVVILATRAHPTSGGYGSSYGGSYGAYLPEKPVYVLGEDGRRGDFKLPMVPNKLTFELAGQNPYELAPGLNGGCFRLPQWKMLTGKNDLCAFERPLVAPRPGHIAMLLAAGALNGTEIEGGEIVKGSSEKIIVSDIDEDAEVRFDRERIVSRLSVLSLATGEVRTWRTDEKQDETREWFAKHGATLAAAVRRDHAPIYDGSTVGVDFSSVQAPGVFQGETEPRILEAQKRGAIAIAKCQKTNKAAVVCGEMGVGKTTIAVTASVLAGHRKVVVVMPTHLVRKWVREVDAITKTKGAALAVKSLADVDSFFADPTKRFLILSKERAKLGARWAPAYTTRRARITDLVPDYEATRLRDAGRWRSSHGMDQPVMKEVTTIKEVLCCPDCGGPLVSKEFHTPLGLDWLEKTKRQCPICKSALWTAQAISARGTTRWPVAKYIAERYSHRYSLIIDEMHQYANASSDQSRAVQLLCSASKRILAMTGTLYGGRASSIFHLLYKVDPGFRALYDYTDSPRFVHDHGLFETVHKLDEYTSRYGNRRNNSGGRVKEIPGVNPAMINLLLGYSVFIKLADLGHTLPPFTETVEIIEHDPEVTESAQHMAAEVKTVLRKHPKILGQYLMACLGYPDCPEHAESIMARAEYGYDEHEVASAPAYEPKLWPKDARLVEIAKHRKSIGRKMLTFFTQTGKRSPIPRVKQHLEDAGLAVAVLSGDIAPDKREEWLLEQAGTFDVLLTNGRLVETGLDLLFATTIVQFGPEYSIPTVRQSTRRSWRLGQTFPVDVIYLAYARTMQEAATALIARKMRAAELVDGDDLGGLAQHDEAGHDFMLELAREVSKL